MNENGSGKLVLLADDSKWTLALLKALEGRGLHPELVILQNLLLSAHVSYSDWELVVNRISARPKDVPQGALALMGKARYLLSVLKMQGIRVLNGERCHGIATSKALQAACLTKLGLPVPDTRLVSASELKTLRLKKGEYLLKPNAGGFGEGIALVEACSPEGFQPDALGVIQELVESLDQRIHRVEMVGGHFLYHASRPLEARTYDYCLGKGESVVRIEDRCAPEIRAECEAIAKAVEMDFGSIEYLINQKGRAEYIDINPVSSYHPKAVEFLGFNPTQRLADFIEKSYPATGK